MKLQGSHLLPATPEAIYHRLTDSAILAQVIPGCERLEQTAPDQYEAGLKIGLGAIKGNYKGKVRLSADQPPHQFTLFLEGKGLPGFVNGKARITLAPEGPATKLTYDADVQVGGLIAAVGSRVIEAAAKKLAEEFFREFATKLGGPPPAAGTPTGPAPRTA